MRITSTVVLLACALVPRANAHAAADPARMQWLCEQRYDAVFHADCTLDRQESSAIPPAADSPTAITPQMTPNRYLPVALRPTAEILSYPVWRVPLYGVPIDATQAEYLLQLVMCGGTPACTVRYERGRHEPQRRTAHPFIR